MLKCEFASSRNQNSRVHKIRIREFTKSEFASSQNVNIVRIIILILKSVIFIYQSSGLTDEQKKKLLVYSKI
jgi:hypothetical protein